MANSPQAKKRARQAEKNRKHNASLRSRMRTTLKQTIAAIESGSADDAKTAFAATEKTLDSMVNKGIIHKNKAARHKSRLNSKIKTLAA